MRFMAQTPKSLKQWMRENSVTQVELGRKISVPQPTVSDWVRGQAVPRAKYILQLEEITGGEVNLRSFFMEAAQ